MPDLVERNQLIEDNLPLVGFLARQVKATATHLCQEELAGVGALALVKAADSFDADRGVPFGAYARKLILFALQDEMRSADFVSRGTRQKIKAVRAVQDQLTRELGRTVTSSDVASAMGIGTDEVNEVLADTANATVTAIATTPEAHSLLAEVALPEETAMMSERRTLLEHAIVALPERMRQVIVDVYIHERPVKDIAEEQGVTHGAVSQQRSEAIRLLRDALEEFDMGTGAEPSATVSASTRRDYLARVAQARFGA